MRDVVLSAEAPPCAHVLEGQVTAVSKRDVLEVKRRKLPAHSPPVSVIRLVLQPLVRIGIHDVPQVAVRDEDVLPSVQIDVEEHRGPRPSTCLNAGIQRELGEGSVPAIDEQRIPLLLQLTLHVARPLEQSRMRRHLGLEAVGVVGEHVDLEEVGESVAVDVGDVHAHRCIAHLPLRGPRRLPKVAATVVEPEHVRVLEVVGDVQFGCAITIEIDESRA